MAFHIFTGSGFEKVKSKKDFDKKKKKALKLRFVCKEITDLPVFFTGKENEKS